MTIQLDQLSSDKSSFSLSVERLITQGPNGLVVQIDYLAELFAEPLGLTGKRPFSWRPPVGDPTAEPEIPYGELTESVCVEWLSTHAERILEQAWQEASNDVRHQIQQAEADKDKPKQTPLPWG